MYKTESLNLCESLMNYTVQIRIVRFVLLSKASLPSKSLLPYRRDLPMFIKSFMGIYRISLENWHRRKKCNVSTSVLQKYNGFKVSSKLCRNLCSRKFPVNLVIYLKKSLMENFIFCVVVLTDGYGWIWIYLGALL